VITISEKQEAWGRHVLEVLVRLGFRVDGDFKADKLGAKIRQAQLEKVPYMLVCGDKEVAASSVAPRARDGQQLPVMPLEVFADYLKTAAAIPRGGQPG
jgi:threonyl-tRNA synthetase